MKAILEMEVGSRLYGLETPTSDTDYQGIYIPTRQEILGFNKTKGEVSLSIVSKLENGRNSELAVDRKFYSIQKFLNLALDNNPNMIEMLFPTDKSIVSISKEGQWIVDNYNLFVSKQSIPKFIGYAKSQRKKMIVKNHNYSQIELAEDYLEGLISKGDSALLLTQCEGDPVFNSIFKTKSRRDNHYNIGERLIVKNQTVKRARAKIQEVIGKPSHRRELVRTCGYDPKFSHHLIRLLLEGIELLEKGRINYPLANKAQLMQIKKGNWKLEDILEYSISLENQIEEIALTSSLQEVSQVSKVEEFMMDVLASVVSN